MKYLKITRSDEAGSYLSKFEGAPGIVESELDGGQLVDVGVSIALTVVEMSEEEYEAAPEFKGW